MASPRPWPFDEDRPSGSVRPLSQADLQAILAHLNDDDPDQLLASTSAGRPVVAVRVRANVGQPGGSAHAQWRRLRGGRVGRLDPDPALAGGRHPRHRCRWGSPWPPGGAPARPGGGRAHGHGGRLGAAVPAQPRRRRLAARGGRGAAHRSAARALERHGWAVLHDLAVPGSRANFDHLVIGPGGVFVVDSKQYRGRLQLDLSGRLWHGRYLLTAVLRAVSFEADRAAQVLADPQVVVPIVAVHGAQVPWGKVVVEGVPVVAARRLPSMLRQLPGVLGPERVATLADRARVRFHPAG
jgi:hypothetical protein